MKYKIVLYADRSETVDVDNESQLRDAIKALAIGKGPYNVYHLPQWKNEEKFHGKYIVGDKGAYKLEA